MNVCKEVPHARTSNCPSQNNPPDLMSTIPVTVIVGDVATLGSV